MNFFEFAWSILPQLLEATKLTEFMGRAPFGG